MSKIILSATGVCKSYHDVGENISVLDQLDLTLYAGEVIAVVGSSGSGKSTLLHLLGGLDKVDAGRIMITVDAEQDKYDDLASLSEKKRCQFRNRYLGFIYQFHHLLPEFTLLENVAMPLWIGRLNRKEGRQRAHAMLEKVGLAARIHHRPAELSGGERQRAAIARALVTRPLCVLADELTGNLDKVTAHNIVTLMQTLAHDMQSAMVLVTHDLAIAALCDKQYTLRLGKLCLTY